MSELAQRARDHTEAQREATREDRSTSTSLATIPLSEAPFTYRTLREIVNTEFVPRGLRGRPDAALAAVMLGREHGLGPMESMRVIDMIDGSPHFSGEYINRLIREAGHRVRRDHLDAKRCTLTGIRKEDPEDEWTETFTIEMAERAGLAGKNNWKKYPEAMLFWRCLTMLARQQFPDVVGAMRMTYVADELGADEPPEPIPTEVESVEVIDVGPAGEGEGEGEGEIAEGEIVDDDDDTDAAEEGEAETAENIPADIPAADTPADPEPLTDTRETGNDDDLEETWAQLYTTLGDAPTTSDTMQVLEVRLREMYRLMDTVGLWPTQPGRPDALHLALGKVAGAKHVGDLRKAELVDFCERSWEAARERIFAMNDPTDTRGDDE